MELIIIYRTSIHYSIVQLHGERHRALRMFKSLKGNYFKVFCQQNLYLSLSQNGVYLLVTTENLVIIKLTRR